MGQHTWFYKSCKLNDEKLALYDKDDAQGGWLSEKDMVRLDEIHDSNEAPYHDCFRTSKRERDGQYTLDVIRSKEDCDRWLRENAGTVHELDQQQVDRFWEEFPNGAIDFG